jgi:hypothetical protein
MREPVTLSDADPSHWRIDADLSGRLRGRMVVVTQRGATYADID